MDHLNYFNPYESIPGHHENQLTRAYLVVLKHSSHAFFTFIEYCRSNHKTSDAEAPISVNDFLEQGWEFETQKKNPEINTNYLLSVLITDSQTKDDTCIKPSERTAIYDGIITFGSNLTMVIENKPRSGNVWFEQRNPSRQNLADDTVIYSGGVELEWKEIIRQLQLLSLPKMTTMSGYERTMIDDFLSFVDENFAYLNPFNRFHQCKGDRELLSRRIQNLLKSIALDESKVKYHRNWGNYIQTTYGQIEKIGLILDQKEGERGYCIELSFYFGNTQAQARDFYNSRPRMEHLGSDEWVLIPNFHVSHINSGLVEFDSEDSEHYLRFWEQHVEQIAQQRKEDVPSFLNWLETNKVIQITAAVNEELNDKFFSTNRKTLNVCPGFGIFYRICSVDAEKLDKEGKLNFVLAEKIKEGLRVAGLDGSELLKQF